MSFKQEVAKCSKCNCGSERLIVNRTHFLCEEKNQERLSRNQSGHKQRAKKVSSGLKAQTKKRASIEAEYRKVQQIIIDDRGFHCNNCSTESNLSFSHLIPRSRRSDLIADERNIVIHCISIGENKGCHEKWEEGDSSMSDYEDNMMRVKVLDFQYYNLLKSKRDA